jgi:hypothetical protein
MRIVVDKCGILDLVICIVSPFFIVVLGIILEIATILQALLNANLVPRKSSGHYSLFFRGLSANPPKNGPTIFGTQGSILSTKCHLSAIKAGGQVRAE